jgi:hypothetical protein
VRQPLQALCAAGDVEGPPVLLVDGLDDSLAYRGQVCIVQLLAACSDFPPRVRFLVTSRPVAPVLDRFRPLAPFILYARSAENRRDVQAYVAHRLAESTSLRAMAGGDGQAWEALQRVSEQSGGNFLVVSKVLDAVQRGEMALDNPKALPAELGDLYFWFLDRLVQRDRTAWRERYRPVLGLLCAAFEPVEGEMLARWTGWEREEVLDTIYNLREFLDPAIDGLYRLYHESVADALTADPASQYYVDLATYHRRITTHYQQAYEKERDWSDCDLYGLRYLPAHRVNADDWTGVTALLTDFGFLEAKCRAASVYELKTDYRSALANWRGELDDRGILQAFEQRPRLESHHINRAPELLFPQLYNHLTWLDAPDGPIHRACERGRVGRAGWLRTAQDPRPAPPPWSRSLEGHKERVSSVAVTPDGLDGVPYVVSGSADHTVKVWEIATGDSRELFGNDSDIYSLALSPDGRWLACGDAMGRVWIFEWVR